MAKEFPNGVDSWIETHHEIVSEINNAVDRTGTIANKIQLSEGRGGLWILGENLTDEFEKMHEGRAWDGEFYDELDEFCSKKVYGS